MLLVVLVGHCGAGQIAMKPLGVYCGGVGQDVSASCDETTPIMWHGNLAMVEHHSAFRVRFQNVSNVPPGNNSILCPLVPESNEVSFASASVVEDTLWIFGTNDKDSDGGKSRTQVHAFWSKDPGLAASSWSHSIILQLPQNGTHDPTKPSWMVGWWTAFNTSPTKGKLANGTDAWVLAIELGSPSSLIGARFTSVFAACTSCVGTVASEPDLSKGWEVLDPTTHIYRKDRYSACPTLRWYKGYYYLVTLFENVGKSCHHGISSRHTIMSSYTNDTANCIL